MMQSNLFIVCLLNDQLTLGDDLRAWEHQIRARAKLQYVFAYLNYIEMYEKQKAKYETTPENLQGAQVLVK